MFIELVEHEAHAVHQAVHVCGLALVVRCSLMRRKRCLERLEVVHPFDGEIVRSYIRLVED